MQRPRNQALSRSRISPAEQLRSAAPRRPYKPATPSAHLEGRRQRTLPPHPAPVQVRWRSAHHVPGRSCRSHSLRPPRQAPGRRPPPEGRKHRWHRTRTRGHPCRRQHHRSPRLAGPADSASPRRRTGTALQSGPPQWGDPDPIFRLPAGAKSRRSLDTRVVTQQEEPGQASEEALQPPATRRAPASLPAPARPQASVFALDASTRTRPSRDHLGTS